MFEALRAGASGFLLKNAPPEQLVARRPDRRGRRRAARAGDHPARHPGLRAASRLHRSTDARSSCLTERELEVLRLLATGKSNAELAAQLFLGEGTIKTHVSHVLSKLGLRDRVQAVVFAYENGLVKAGSA